ncbi:MAG: serine/threonine protein phosphatase [Ktedonobacteraceae bacterium]|nr:serine/threonine protein phosphatase [Ktedonobacteraceae bacterium]
MATQHPTYVIGDIHGQFKRLVGLLQSVGLIGDALQWTGGASTLWFMGDLVDRGPDGIPVIDLVMRLQAEAAAVNGCVASLLGNHEMLLLAAYRFGRRSTGLGSSFLSKWKRNGGNRKDLASLKLEHLGWLANLPAMAHVDDHLFIHADAPLYLKYGRSVQEVNAAIKDLLRRSDSLAWEELLEDFVRRGIFYSDRHGEVLAQRFLDLYGGQCLVHGHTPISYMLGCQPKKVTRPLLYAGGRCVNVDSGLYLGGHGFVSRLPFSSEEH